jgi:uncharacterized protein YbaR (Trm112 family)
LIAKELLDILACPACRGEVFLLEEEQRIVCKRCGRRYPIRDGIPIMLVEEAEKDGGAGEVLGRQEEMGRGK